MTFIHLLEFSGSFFTKVQNKKNGSEQKLTAIFKIITWNYFLSNFLVVVAPSAVSTVII